MNIFLPLALTLLPISVISITYLKLTNSIATLGDLKHPEFLHDFFTSKRGLYFVFFWAIAESLYWWVFPDFLLLIAALYVRSFFPKILIYAFLGTVTGGIIAFAFGFAFPSASQTIIGSVPFVSDEMRAFAAEALQKKGAMGVLYHLGSWVPFKVFAHTAGQEQVNFITFMVTGAFLRLLRFAIAYVVMYVIAKFAGNLLRRIPTHYVLIVFTIIFTFGLVYMPRFAARPTI